MSIVVDKVLTVSTPGESVDFLVTQYGIAVNPRRPELREALERAHLPVADIHELRKLAQTLNGPAAPFVPKRERVVAQVLGRDSQVQDLIYGCKTLRIELPRKAARPLRGIFTGILSFEGNAGTWGAFRWQKILRKF